MADGNLNSLAHQASLQTLEAVANQPGISDVFRTALRREIAHQKSEAEERSRYRGVCWSGMGPEPARPVSLAQIKSEADREEEERVAYLTSNLGKARKSIADASRTAANVQARLEDVAAALSRGDGSAIRKSESCAEALHSLRVLVADVDAFVRLHQAECGQ